MRPGATDATALRRRRDRVATALRPRRDGGCGVSGVAAVRAVAARSRAVRGARCQPRAAFANLMGMRNTVIALALALATLTFAGCLSSAHPAATRAETRFEIARAIAAEGGQPRSIVEVKETGDDSALVVTQPRGGDGARQQERWVHGADGWKLAGVEGGGDALVKGPAASAEHAD